MKGLRFGFERVVWVDCWGKEFIKGVTNTMDRQTESIMAGAVRRIQALAPEKDDQCAGDSQERSRGVGGTCVAGVGSLLTAFLLGGVFHSKSVQPDFLIPKQAARKGVATKLPFPGEKSRNLEIHRQGPQEACPCL